MTHYFVDTNVFLYARGGAHPYREPCRRILDGARRGDVQLLASVELVQEFLRILLRRGVDRQDALEQSAEVRRQCRIAPFDDQVLTLALVLVQHYESLGARDAVHAATAVAAGVRSLLSADQVFDTVAEIDRVDPKIVAAEVPVDS